VAATERAAGTGRQWALLLGLSTASFLAATGGLVIVPFLLTIASELETDLAAISVLFAVSNLTWAVGALGAGPLSDRLGRKPVLLSGMALLAICCFGAALAQDYPSLAFWRFGSGLAGGSQTPIAFAAASDLFPAARRGRALGWVMTGQSMSLVLGTPLSALVGSLSGWRWSVGGVGLATLVSLVALASVLPRPPRREARSAHAEASLLQLVADVRVMALFGASSLERVCYSSVVIFFATYLIVTYELPLDWLAGALVVVALGNVLGNQLGGRLADRVQAKHVLVGVAMICNGLLALPLLLGAPGVLASIGLGLLYNLANAVGRPSLIWLISEISHESRGAIMGLTITVAAVGWLIASAVGGWLVAGYGFGPLGLLAAASGLGSAALAALTGYVGRSPARGEARADTPVSTLR